MSAKLKHAQNPFPLIILLLLVIPILSSCTLPVRGQEARAAQPTATPILPTQNPPTVVSSTPTLVPPTAAPLIAASISPTVTLQMDRQVAGLAPATAQQPTAGICADANKDDVIVKIIINPDTPLPRCSKVLATQRLQVINRTSTTVEVQLAQFDAQVAPGATHTFDAMFGTYLASGVHLVFISAYPGSGGAELWLVDKP